MIHLLYTVILSEMTLILTLLFKTPLRKLVIMSLDRVKRGKGPVMVKTVASTIFVVLLSSVYSIIETQQRTEESGILNPTDQVLVARNMLEASLMGFVLFLSLMIDRLHHYIRELRLLRKTMAETSKKQTRGIDDVTAEDTKSLREEINFLTTKISTAEAQLKEKENEVMSAQAKTENLHKQWEDLKMENATVKAEIVNNQNQLEFITHSVS